MNQKSVKVRALRTAQAEGLEVYSFYLPGGLITQLADISRIQRDAEHVLHGFQRKAIRSHIQEIVDYLDRGSVLFPNAIILAFSDQIRFRANRSKSAADVLDTSLPGVLEIPQAEEGQRAAWIVDGQQRSLALAQSRNQDLAVPVVGFVAPDLASQREQFILVNKARPLPGRLINELLPGVDSQLPADLAARRIPSALCDRLNREADSPFYQMVIRESGKRSAMAVVPDTALMDIIRKSMENPAGALAPYREQVQQLADLDDMYAVLVVFWRAVAEAFPQAWGVDARQSRLMHPTGLKAMGALMDRIMVRLSHVPEPATEVSRALQAIAPNCHWTEGRWPGLDLGWNEVSTAPQVKALARYLIKLDFEQLRIKS